MPKQDFIAALDLGTSKVACFIGELVAKQNLSLIGRSVAPHRGMKRGAIVDIDEVTQAIRKAVGEAENQAGVTISEVFVSLSGDFISSINSRGAVAIAHGNREILETDVRRVIDAARVVGIPTGREVIHVMPCGFMVDGHDGIRNPVGMSGLGLEVETHIVTGGTTYLQNVKKCLEGAELEVAPAGMVAASIASSLAVLHDEEKELGTAVLDIGAGTSDLIIFRNGHIAHTAVLSVGGAHITYDIATALKLLPTEAERVKVEYGRAMPGDLDEETTVEVATLSGSDPEQIVLRDVAEIIELRLEDIFEWMRKEMDKAARRGARAASVVITGGTANLQEITTLAREKLEVPVRVGKPETAAWFPGAVRHPSYSTVSGLLMYGYAKMVSETREKKTSSRVKHVLQRVVSVLEELF
ncbi:MAG: cell division protein FtsA [Candidatus Xenobia bacterium]